MTEVNIDGACVKVNAPHVIHEAIDGEVIIINLATGTYYSLKGSAADAWGLIQEPGGVRISDLVLAFETRFDTPRIELERALEPFLAQLKDEGLVAWTEEGTGDAPRVADRGASNGARRSFEPPALEKFTDMQDLVLLDPVHEVAEIGWPHVPSDEAPSSASA